KLDKPFNHARIVVKDSSVYTGIFDGTLSVPVVTSGLNVFYRPSNVLKYPVRVAIDPGHVAGDWEEAYLEGHFIENRREKVRFFESELTMATALTLKQKLQADGYLVMLTRNWREGANGKSFKKWYKQDFKNELRNELLNGSIDSSRYRRLLSASRQEVFESYYRINDLRERAKKINLFKPDITIIIHYNSSEFQSKKGKDAPISDYNFASYFIPGGFTLAELSSPSQEQDIFRLLSTNTVERSARLSDCVAREFKKAFPIADLSIADTTFNDIPWLKKFASPTAFPNVFGRNLYLTRVIKSPLVYGEPFLQNNRKLIHELNRRDYKIEGIRTSSVVPIAAQCYYNGILRYLKEGNFSVVFE
ncbi:MAG: N-acetylmuramoyl-L-alanine amidase, partial [Cytophagales bacterium]|nr:N-acetylmuramoyl-L-alanine amidase [Cytophagales bacterium]